MTEEILVNHTAHETRIAVVMQGVVQELHLERVSTRGLVGNVYLGKVSRVLPGMQSAFIDIGLERAAFLHVADLWQSRAHGAGSHTMPIEKVLFEGQPLLVQVIKDPIGTKGARSCARACRRSCPATSAAASSSVPRPKMPPTRSSRATSPTCASAGARSSTTASSSPPRRCCIRN